MEDELLVFLDEDLVHLLHVQLGTERDGGQGLGLAAGEDGAAVCAGQIADLAPDGADFVGLAAVEAQTFVEDHVAHGFLLHVVVVAVDHCGLELLILFGKGCEELVLDGGESVFALMLGLGGLSEGVALVVAEFADGLAEVFVLLVVGIVAFCAVGAELGHELLLDAAVLLYLFVGEFDGLEHVLLADFLHFAFDHHDVFLGCGDHQFEVGVLVLAEGRVDDPLAVDPCDADFGDGTAEGQVGSGEGAGGGQAGEGVGLDVLLGGNQADVDEDFQVEIIRPQRADGAVDQTGDEHLVVGGTAFALEETSGETAGGIVLFAVVYGKGHEISAFLDLFGACDGGQEHGATHLDDGRTVGLLGKFAGFDLDDPSVGQRDLLSNDVH